MTTKRVSNVRLRIKRQGELPPLVEIQNENTMTLKLRIPEGAGPLPLSNALAGNIVFVTRPQFRGSQITFTEATFTTIDPGANGETPAKAAFASETIMPNVVLDIRSFVTNVPVATVRPVTEAVTDTRAIIKGEYNKPGIITAFYGMDRDNLVLSVQSIDEITRFRLALGDLTPRTRYFFQTKSVNADGESELSPPNPAAFVTRDLDNTPPRILKGPGIFGRTPTSAKIGFELNEAATSEIAYGTAPDALGATASGPADPTRIHSVRVSGLTPGEETFFQVTVTDLNSNQGQSPVLSFRPLLVADTRPLAILGRPSAFGSFDRANVEWRTSRRSNSAIFYSVDRDAIDILQVGVGTKALFQDEADEEDEAEIDSVTVDEEVLQHRIPLANLQADTTLYAKVRSADVSGNTVVSPTFAIVTTSVEDEVAPKFVRPPGVLFISDTEATIGAGTNEPTVVEIQYSDDRFRLR